MSAGSHNGRPIRALVLGPLRPPHVSEQVLGLAERGFEVQVAGDTEPGADLEVMGSAGIPVALAPELTRRSVGGMRRLIAFVRDLVEEFEPDVVQAHWVPGYAFAAASAGVRSLATTAWGSDIYRANRLQDMASRYAIKRSLSVMADSADLLERCVELGAPRDRTQVVNWGVDLDIFRPAGDDERVAIKERLGLGSGPVILSPRSLMPVYNVPEIIMAFDRLAGDYPDAQLVIKHMGNASVDLPASAHPDRVHLVGRIPYEEMADYYRIADACVSIASSDSSPRSVWEAMAAGAPCVLSDLPWVDELISRDRDAVTVPATDVEAVAAAIGELIGSPERRREMSRNARSLVESNLGRNDQMDLLADVLRSVADEGNGKR